MKNSTTALLMIFGLSFACQDSGENKSTKSSALKNVGGQIPFSFAEKWIANFNTKNNRLGRDGYPTYSITASQLESMLKSVPDLAGVAFHYGTDDSGVLHIAAIPVQSLDVWASIPGQILTDANTSTAVDQSHAKAWAEAYQKIYPNDVRFHFFGANIFKEIAMIPYFTKLEIEQALDNSGVPQLLLIIRDYTTTSTGGRSKGNDPVVYDASTQCPPTCNP